MRMNVALSARNCQISHADVCRSYGYDVPFSRTRVAGGARGRRRSRDEVHMASKRASRTVRAELQDVIARLKQLQSTLAVAVGALRNQNADIDVDIANLLQRSVADTLQEQIEKLEALAGRLPGSRAQAR